MGVGSPGGCGERRAACEHVARHASRNIGLAADRLPVRRLVRAALQRTRGRARSTCAPDEWT